MGEKAAGNGDGAATPAADESRRAEDAAAISGNECGTLVAVDDDDDDAEEM